MVVNQLVMGGVYFHSRKLFITSHSMSSAVLADSSTQIKAEYRFISISVHIQGQAMKSYRSEDEFRLQGYSSESLKLLETEEGQLNAVYACYGSAAAEGQFFEDAVRNLLKSVCRDYKPSARDGLKKMIDRLSERIRVTDERIWDLFHEARSVRNRLIHHYFRNTEYKFRTYEGRMEMLQELVTIETPIRKAKELISGMNMAVIRELKNKQSANEELVITLSDDVENTYLPPHKLG